MSEDLRSALETRFQGTDPSAFEHVIAELFRQKGYEAEVTPQSGDFGADLIVSMQGRRTAVQVKRYAADNSVGVQTITHLAGGMRYYSCDEAICVTTSSYTQQATDMATQLGVELWDWERLERELTATYGESDEGLDVELDNHQQEMIRLADAAVLARGMELSRDDVRLACINGEIEGAQPKGQAEWVMPRESFDAWWKSKHDAIMAALLDEQQKLEAELAEQKRQRGQKQRMENAGQMTKTIIAFVLIAVLLGLCANLCSY